MYGFSKTGDYSFKHTFTYSIELTATIHCVHACHNAFSHVFSLNLKFTITKTVKAYNQVVTFAHIYKIGDWHRTLQQVFNISYGERGVIYARCSSACWDRPYESSPSISFSSLHLYVTILV
ncbi:hypothetical protein P3S67_029038 [Capsicum chacoense]